MSFKNFLEYKSAVSSVIGVVLMVAITVILAAAIGSSVFGQGTIDSAPQANLHLSVNSSYGSAETPEFASIHLEHLGGDPINFTSNSTTKIIVYSPGSKSQEIAAGSAPSSERLHTNLKSLAVGETKSLKLYTYTLDNNDKCLPYKYALSGSTVNFKIIDVATNQLICDQNVRF
ncbi:MAG: type IV pilin N-terminal domain-containing protein [Methanosarcinaceae archaeon]|nr:type IV pilin N-terminal domain-containing protein [Methanosarcinaceae archaeon]MDD4330855.1 type IV pilin N-terminal domain-containing protein [Methanosarcinaceae archaeon]